MYLGINWPLQSWNFFVAKHTRTPQHQLLHQTNILSLIFLSALIHRTLVRSILHLHCSVHLYTHSIHTYTRMHRHSLTLSATPSWRGYVYIYIYIVGYLYVFLRRRVQECVRVCVLFEVVNRCSGGQCLLELVWECSACERSWDLVRLNCLRCQSSLP